MLLHLLSSVLLLTFEYTILFSLHFSVLHNLSWYQSYSSKPLHTVGRATRSSQHRACTHLESTRHSLFTRLGELAVILFKDRSNKLAEEAERTALERSWTKRTQKKKPCTIFSKNRQKLTQKSCRTKEV
jgi:hypothetical protein